MLAELDGAKAGSGPALTHRLFFNQLVDDGAVAAYGAFNQTVEHEEDGRGG